MNLRALQREFVAALYGEATPALALVRAGGTTGALGVDIYRNNLSSNHRAALAGTYPVIRKLVGDEFFGFVTRRYVASRRSRSGDIGEMARAFPNFLAELPEAEELPYLADVAHLEWAWLEVFNAAPGPVLDIRQLAAMTPEEHARLRFGLSQGVRLVASEFPILRIWQMAQDDYRGDDHVHLAVGGDRLLLTRGADFCIGIERLSAGMHQLLASIALGVTLAAAVEAALAVDAGFDLARTLPEIIRRGIIV